MRKVYALALTGLLLASCVTTPPPAHHPAREIGRAIGYVVVSPALILVGILEGIAALPYFLHADLHAMNDTMRAAHTNVTLGRTYRYAYDRRIETVPASGDTGRAFQHLSEATVHFQKVLRGYGVRDYDRYVITAVRTADQDGFTLYALVYRPPGRIRVADRFGRVRTLGPDDLQDYYRPFERDASGAPLDAVIDWAGVPRTAIKTQKGQAILLTLAASSVMVNRRSVDFWSVRRRWMAGRFRQIASERKRMIARRLGKRR